jgi:ubiquinone/menaquinone biosynthesis C-methylase UbiE
MKKHSGLSVGHQEERGRLVARFIEDAVQPLENLKVLDLGCGQGDISAAFGASRARLALTDISPSNVMRARERIRFAPEPAVLCVSNALELPFGRSQFDLVLLNGVLEWVGKAAPERNPEACQLQVLKEVHRTLKEGGWVYVAIENRCYPYWILRDPHINVPLVAVLPRPMANFFHRLVTGQPYVTYIHSYRKLRLMIQDAGFTEIKFYVPLLHYRWPFSVVPASDSQRIAKEITALRQKFRDRNGSLSWSEELKFAFYRYTALLGLSPLLFPSFAVLARRT